MAFCRANDVFDQVATEHVARPGRMVAALTELAETHRSDKRPVDYTVHRHIIVAFVSPNCSERLRPQNPINQSVIVASARKPALYLYNQMPIPVVVVVVTVIVRVVRIGIRIEDRKPKRVDKDEPPVMEMAEMMCARHCS
jgi:hypothetical protein